MATQTGSLTLSGSQNLITGAVNLSGPISLNASSQLTSVLSSLSTTVTNQNTMITSLNTAVSNLATIVTNTGNTVSDLATIVSNMASIVTSVNNNTTTLNTVATNVAAQSTSLTNISTNTSTTHADLGAINTTIGAGNAILTDMEDDIDNVLTAVNTTATLSQDILNANTTMSTTLSALDTELASFHNDNKDLLTLIQNDTNNTVGILNAILGAIPSGGGDLTEIERILEYWYKSAVPVYNRY